MTPALSGALGLLLSCAASPPPPPERMLPAPAVASGLDAGFRSVEASGQGLEFLLPDADGWRHDPRDTHSWVATHAATRSRLLARSWKADSIVRAADCERQLRALRPDLPALAPEERMERRELTVAGDYAAELTTGARASCHQSEPGQIRAFAYGPCSTSGEIRRAARVSPASADDGALAGYGLLFGSDGRRCLALVFATWAEGGSAARQVGERLGIVSRAVFERVRRLDIPARVLVPRR